MSRNPGAGLSVGQMMRDAWSRLKLTLVPIEVEVEPKTERLLFDRPCERPPSCTLVVGDPEYTLPSLQTSVLTLAVISAPGAAGVRVL